MFSDILKSDDLFYSGPSPPLTGPKSAPAPYLTCEESLKVNIFQAANIWGEKYACFSHI